MSIPPTFYPKDIARVEKHVIRDSGWRAGPMGPRHAPVYLKSKMLNKNWEWRSLELAGEDGSGFFLVIEASPSFGRWKGFLMTDGSKGNASVLIRIEDQPGKSGLHVHTSCRGEWQHGPASIALPNRRPDHNRHHRRQIGWTKETFLRQCTRMLHICLDAEQQKDLFDGS